MEVQRPFEIGATLMEGSFGTESLPEYTIETMDMSVMANAFDFWLHSWDNLQS
jgi:hypothetical protein